MHVVSRSYSSKLRAVLTGSIEHSDHPGLLLGQTSGSVQNKLLRIAFPSYGELVAKAQVRLFYQYGRRMGVSSTYSHCEHICR